MKQVAVDTLRRLRMDYPSGTFDREAKKLMTCIQTRSISREQLFS